MFFFVVVILQVGCEFEFVDCDFCCICDLIYQCVGILLVLVKCDMVYGCLLCCLCVFGMCSFYDYFDQFEVYGGDEWQVFINVLIINLIVFFCELYYFEKFIDELCVCSGYGMLQLWLCVVFIGEELYLMVIIVCEIFGMFKLLVCILVMDVDIQVLVIVSWGVYVIDCVFGLDLVVCKCYFQCGIGFNEGYCCVLLVLCELIDFCLFNLFVICYDVGGFFDVLFCCNVMIYFDKFIQCGIFLCLIQYMGDDGLFYIGYLENYFYVVDLIQFCGCILYKCVFGVLV